MLAISKLHELLTLTNIPHVFGIDEENRHRVMFGIDGEFKPSSLIFYANYIVVQPTTLQDPERDQVKAETLLVYYSTKASDGTKNYQKKTCTIGEAFGMIYDNCKALVYKQTSQSEDKKK